MPSNISTASTANHSLDLELEGFQAASDTSVSLNEQPEHEATPCYDADSLDALTGLRDACAAARAVLCEAILNDSFDSVAAAAAVGRINNAIVRSSFLE